MALKPRAGRESGDESENLAVPSYGAMALKRRHKSRDQAKQDTCSPLLRGDGPETKAKAWTPTQGPACSPLLRGDGPETLTSALLLLLALALQSPPTGRWP